MRWQDFLDIFLNSFILFRLYALFKHSRFISIVPLAIVLAILKRAAMSMGLVVTSWAIQGIIAAAALILIIVFRDEIASVFQTRSLKSFLWGFPSRRTFTPVEIISESVFEMGTKRIGALIVFPQTKEIDDLLRARVSWDGRVSKQMIMSIFWNGNPVHDGAILIKGNRITDVGVILPLSRREDIPARYGTRHRAALGIAEQSDCLVTAVSEETGQVTVVMGSSITDVKSSEQLKEILEKYVGTDEGSGKTYWSRTVEITVSALASLIIVTGVWLGLSRGKETLKTINVPVEYTDIKQGFEIIEASTNIVTLHLGGSKALLQSLKPEHIKVILSLSHASTGENSYPVINDNIALPPGLSLKKVEPAEVELIIGSLVTKRLPIQLDWVGKMPENLIIESADIKPETFEVTGLNPGIEKVFTLYTEKIPLESIKGSGKLEVDVILQPASLKTSEKSRKVFVSYKVKTRDTPLAENGLK